VVTGMHIDEDIKNVETILNGHWWHQSSLLLVNNFMLGYCIGVLLISQHFFFNEWKHVNPLVPFSFNVVCKSSSRTLDVRWVNWQSWNLLDNGSTLSCLISKIY
jgi:hypothetical protein